MQSSLHIPCVGLSEHNLSELPAVKGSVFFFYPCCCFFFIPPPKSVSSPASVLIFDVFLICFSGMERAEGRLNMKAIAVNYPGEILACMLQGNILRNNMA